MTNCYLTMKIVQWVREKSFIYIIEWEKLYLATHTFARRDTQCRFECFSMVAGKSLISVCIFRHHLFHYKTRMRKWWFENIIYIGRRIYSAMGFWITIHVSCKRIIGTLKGDLFGDYTVERITGVVKISQ